MMRVSRKACSLRRAAACSLALCAALTLSTAAAQAGAKKATKGAKAEVQKVVVIGQIAVKANKKGKVQEATVQTADGASYFVVLDKNGKSLCKALAGKHAEITAVVLPAKGNAKPRLKVHSFKETAAPPADEPAPGDEDTEKSGAPPAGGDNAE